MSRTTLQIPLDSTLRKEAEAAAAEQGFSSLQEAVRVFLKKLASRAVGFRMEEGIQLSDKAIRRYDKMTKEFEEGKDVYEAEDIDDLMDQLNADKI